MFKFFIFLWKGEKLKLYFNIANSISYHISFFAVKGEIFWTALPTMHPPSRGTAWVFTPTIPTAASTTVDLEIAKEQPLLRSKRRRTLRSVVHGFGVLVSPLRSVCNRRVHLCSCEFTIVSVRKIRLAQNDIFPYRFSRRIETRGKKKNERLPILRNRP